MNNKIWNIYIIPTDTCFGLACALDDKKNYHKIYKIKKRRMDNPLALMVESFDWLEENTDLTLEQIDFLKEYEKPFTILTQSRNVEMYLKFEDEEEWMFENNDIYDFIAFRVAHNPIQKKLIKRFGPIWLTSANLSGKPELYSLKDVEKQFEYYLDKWVLEIRWAMESQSWTTTPSDVFSFVGEDLEVDYKRKS